MTLPASDLDVEIIRLTERLRALKRQNQPHRRREYWRLYKRRRYRDDAAFRAREQERARQRYKRRKTACP